MTPAVSARELYCSYEREPVVRGIDFSLEEGGFHIIIGPNGSGKSTILKSLCGILRPISGQVRIFGRLVKDFTPKALARVISYVPQYHVMDFPFHVEDTVLMGRTPHLGILGIESAPDLKKAKEAMEFTQVSHLAGRKLSELSGGECKRVFIARAICQDSRIILLDEPTASLDPAHQIRIMDLMENLKKEKQVTVVMVSHDLNLAGLYGDNLLLLREGKMVKTGKTDEVLTFETLEKAYECPILVDKSPFGDFPRVTLVPGRYLDPALKKR